MRDGTRELFQYNLCDNCQSLVLQNIPTDYKKYYTNYYTGNKKYYTINFLRKLFWRLRSFISMYLAYSLTAKISYNTMLKWAHLTRISYSSKILDVGCGNGDILFEFKKHGFSDLTGIDPFPPENMEALKSISISKDTIFTYNTSCSFDLIMFNHSLEHMNDHERVLEKAMQLLHPDGKLLIRMPIINEAFYNYLDNWVQIDAPRHIIIHSVKSFKLLAEKLGLEVTHIFYDSTTFQFLGSEQNLKDISFFAENSYQVDKGRSIFSEEDFLKYKVMVKEYNATGKGDQAGFVLRIKK